MQQHDTTYARLQTLANSVNDAARTARVSLSLVLLTALYLGLTLLSSNDENVLINGQVTLPQIGVGLSVLQSYIFGPIVFLYLHAQTLVLLVVLRRKQHTFENALREEVPDTLETAEELRKNEVLRSEYRDWLSSFGFVQIFGSDAAVSLSSRSLMWAGTTALPVFLLLAIDISFVRNQSSAITWTHHAVFILDLVFLAYFNWRVFGHHAKGRAWEGTIYEEASTVVCPGRSLHGLSDDFGLFRTSSGWR